MAAGIVSATGWGWKPAPATWRQCSPTPRLPRKSGETLPRAEIFI